jgi:dTDP-4-amino-4,6-dideoxygalactose transaminase
VTPVPFEHPVYVTRPLFPDLAAYAAALEGIWQRRWLTNKGELHERLEQALRAHLRVANLSLVSSGTSGLMLALRALGVSGEVITTPFTSPATLNAIIWCGLTPVFADIDPDDMTLDPHAVARAVTPRTRAILGVHIFGIPCRVEPLQALADRHGLHVIYDGAHAFGSEIDGEPIASYGDATVLSFHATKLFTTGEGGAVVTRDPALKRQIDLWRSLGIADENTVVLPGINARMNELEAALGLANLECVEAERRARAEIDETYRACLAGIEGLRCFRMPGRARNSYPYFVVRITAARRDAIYQGLKAFNVFARRYFHPLCSNFPYCADIPSADPDNLPVANRVADEVLCLPFYGELGGRARRIGDMVAHLMTPDGRRA